MLVSQGFGEVVGPVAAAWASLRRAKITPDNQHSVWTDAAGRTIQKPFYKPRNKQLWNGSCKHSGPSNSRRWPAAALSLLTSNMAWIIGQQTNGSEAPRCLKVQPQLSGPSCQGPLSRKLQRANGRKMKGYVPSATLHQKQHGTASGNANTGAASECHGSTGGIWKP